MSPSEIKALLLKRRAKWVEVGVVGEGDARRVQRVRFIRPPETQLHTLLTSVDQAEGKAVWSVELEHVKKYSEDWEGFVTADFVGAAVGDSDPVAFDRELFAVWVEDNVEAQRKIANAILNSTVDYLTARDATAKNSTPGSTPGTAEATSTTPTTT